MPRYDLDKPRLCVSGAIAQGAPLPLEPKQVNYLRNVLRLAEGAQVLVFNGRDGEWLADLAVDGRKSAHLVPIRQVRPQPAPGDLDYMFAPLKHARLDYMVQKAVEMGATRLAPVVTRRTQASRVNIERMRANAVEAAEQCGVLQLAEVLEPAALDRVLRDWPAGRVLVFCDEGEPVADPVERLRHSLKDRPPPLALAVLIGPEGGFDEAECAAIRALPETVTIALGPRILRADTAAVAALAVVQAAVGDWTGK